jgi:uncharacterized oxidoreductase
MLSLDAARLEELTARILKAAGADADAAAAVAGSLILSNIRGVDSHGFMRVQDYCEAIRLGRLDPTGRPVIVADEGSFIKVDGNRSFGQLAARFATNLVVEKAHVTGIALVTLANVLHVGRLGEFAEQAAERGSLALILCNSGPAGGCVVPFGGASRALGTNPLAYGVPAATEPDIIADFSTSMAAEGRVRLARDAGQRVPSGWLVDRNGEPSIDPQAFYDGGALLPMAGHKGYALSLLVEIAGGVLAGAGCASRNDEPGNGFVMIAIDVNRLLPTDAFEQGADQVISALKNVHPADGFSSVVTPGMPERTLEIERTATGIPFSETTWTRVSALAATLEVDLTPYAPDRGIHGNV